MMYVRIIIVTYYNLYGGVMRGKYYLYINITFHFLYVLSQQNVPLIKYFVAMKMNLIQSNEYIFFGWF